VLSRDATHLQTRQKCSTNFFFSFFSLLLLFSRTNEPKRWRFFVTSSPENVCFLCVCVYVQYDIIIIICQRTHINITAILFFFIHEGNGVWISFRWWPPVTPTFYFERRDERVTGKFPVLKKKKKHFFLLLCFDWKWNELNCNFEKIKRWKMEGNGFRLDEWFWSFKRISCVMEI
jgi:hypothetical protein